MRNLTKENVKKYFRDNWDLTFDLIVSDLKVSKKEIPKLQKVLNELIEEGWVTKNYCGEHKVEEYDPGFKFGVWTKVDVRTRADDL